MLSFFILFIDLIPNPFSSAEGVGDEVLTQQKLGLKIHGFRSFVITFT